MYELAYIKSLVWLTPKRGLNTFQWLILRLAN